MFRALAVLRVLLLVNTVALNLYRRDNFGNPWPACLSGGGDGGVDGVAIWAYADPRRAYAAAAGRRPRDRACWCSWSPWVKGADFNATVPGFWVMGALLAWAIHWRLVGGVVAAVCWRRPTSCVRDEPSTRATTATSSCC